MIKFLSKFIVATATAFIVTVSAPTPAAALTAVNCATTFNRFHSESAVAGFNVAGSGMTFRGVQFVTMNHIYNPSVAPIHTPPSVPHRRASLSRSANGNEFSGNFSIVFPDRGNFDVDRAQLRITRGGVFSVRSITWNGTWGTLQGVTCYRGESEAIIVTGHTETTFWNFTMVPYKAVVLI